MFVKEYKKRLEKWEAVFFTSDDEKLEFENMFAKKICDSDNELYMSWLPLKLGDIGGDKELVCNLKITTSNDDNKQTQSTTIKHHPVLAFLKAMKNQQ